MSITKNINPELKDLLDAHEKDIKLSLNCHSIGTIESFDSSKQIANVTINYKKTYVKKDDQGINRNVLVEYPILLDCPVIVMSGGSFSLKMPIKKGDTCLILFNDRDIDNWFESGQITELSTARLHSFSDGIALVGLRHSQNSIAGYQEDKASFGNGTTDITLGDKINIKNGVDDLFSILNDLLTEIQLITVVNGGGTTGPPLNAAAFSAIATRLAGFLE